MIRRNKTNVALMLLLLAIDLAALAAPHLLQQLTTDRGAKYGVAAEAPPAHEETPEGAVAIDSSFVAAHSTNGVLYLDQAGTTYYLETDITASGTAIAIVAADITLDLNGFTVTYDDATPISIANASFETVDGSDSTHAEGWDWTNAPASTTRFAGEYFLNQIYDGDYSIRFNDTTDSGYIESQEFTLAANTTYSISAMLGYGSKNADIQHTNPGVVGYVKAINTSDDSELSEATTSETNYRGIRHCEGIFTTGGSPVTCVLRAGITGHASGDQPFFIDDVKVQRHKQYGVVPQIYAWSPTNYRDLDLDEAGSGTNATIRNGTIIQGSDGGTSSHGIFLHQLSGCTIDNVDITVNGADCSCICGLDQGEYSTIVTDNSLASINRTVTSRDAFDGAVMKGVGGVIARNVITNGPHAGIYAGGTVASNIYGNTIRLKAKYTNAFAIIGSLESQIHNNQILNGEGEYTSHGIGIPLGTEETPGRVYNNTIEVHQPDGVNQEYGGYPTGGCYGLQCDNGIGTGIEGPAWAEVYDNNVTVNGTTEGYCFRLTDPGEARLHVYDNVLQAVAEEGGHCSPISIYGDEVVEPPFRWETDNYTFEDNTFITNDGIALTCTRVPEVRLVRTTFQRLTPISGPQPYTSYYNPGVDPHVFLHFIDTVFADTDSRDYFEAATVKYYGVEPAIADDRMAVYQSWTTTIQVNDASDDPIQDATVVIDDGDDVEVFNDTTAANGRAIAVLIERSVQGTTFTDHNDHTATVTKGGYAFSPATITADEPQTITVGAE